MEAVGDVKLAIFFLSAFIPVALVILLAVWANEGVEGGKERISERTGIQAWYWDDWFDDARENSAVYKDWVGNAFYLFTRRFEDV